MQLRITITRLYGVYICETEQISRIGKVNSDNVDCKLLIYTVLFLINRLLHIVNNVLMKFLLFSKTPIMLK